MKDGISYNSSVSFYYCQKFANVTAAQRAIRAQKNPSMAAYFGRRANFNPRQDWEDPGVKDAAMCEALRLKFDQHPQLQEQLLATHGYELVEMNPTDPYWSIGKHGNGQNMLGKLLMDLRTRYKSQRSAEITTPLDPVNYVASRILKPSD